ncbi:hypothetical protein LTR85_006687 [Meristemomyces frigidus]|nr:hypothetical protein LTR85_006687 [Meristemomyces frigidus]
MATSNAQVSSSRLLSLPPEMRNRIYRAVLVEDGIRIEAPNHIPLPPALLQTCRQIRRECRGIFLKENEFMFDINDNDATLYIRWCRHFSASKDVSTTFDIEPSKNWPNALVWMKAVFHHECTGPLPPPSSADRDEQDRCTDVLCHMYEVTTCLSEVRGVSWKVAERILKDVHGAVAAADPAWA